MTRETTEADIIVIGDGTAAALSVRYVCSVRQADVLKPRKTLIGNDACFGGKGTEIQ